jgi:hypothetical protein
MQQRLQAGLLLCRHKGQHSDKGWQDRLQSRHHQHHLAVGQSPLTGSHLLEPQLQWWDPATAWQCLRGCLQLQPLHLHALLQLLQ